MAKSDWVRVRSESELRPGMALKHDDRGWCGRTHVGFVIRRLEERRRCPDHRPECPSAWRIMFPCEPIAFASYCLSAALTAGRLYRLRDLGEADETTEVTKELETVR